VYVKNLDDTFTDEQLRETFQPFGTITSAKVMSSGETPKGFGFVCFASPEEAAAAITAMNNKSISMNKKPLYVALAQTKAERQAMLQQHFMQQHQGVQMQMQVPMQRGNVRPGQHMFPAAMAPFYYPPQTFYQPRQGPGALMPAQSVVPPSQFVSRFQPAVSAYPQANFQQAGRGRGGKSNTTGPRTMPANKGTRRAVSGHPDMNGIADPSMMQSIPPHMPGMGMGQVPVGSYEVSLADMNEEQRKRVLGERLYPEVFKLDQAGAAKITGMLLEMDHSELIALLEDPALLRGKVEEAQQVLRAHQGA
jgi:polyadenylate-binding protein